MEFRGKSRNFDVKIGIYVTKVTYTGLVAEITCLPICHGSHPSRKVIRGSGRAVLLQEHEMRP